MTNDRQRYGSHRGFYKSKCQWVPGKYLPCCALGAYYYSPALTLLGSSTKRQRYAMQQPNRGAHKAARGSVDTTRGSFVWATTLSFAEKGCYLLVHADADTVHACLALYSGVVVVSYHSRFETSRKTIPPHNAPSRASASAAATRTTYAFLGDDAVMFLRTRAQTSSLHQIRHRVDIQAQAFPASFTAANPPRSRAI